MRYFKISEDQLRDLIGRSNLLDALRAYGVDNWDDVAEIYIATNICTY